MSVKFPLGAADTLIHNARQDHCRHEKAMLLRYGFTSVLIISSLFASGCAWFAANPGIGGPIDWSKVPGWEDDRHAEAWPALQNSCQRLATQTDPWQQICERVAGRDTPSDSQAKQFFEAHFNPHRVHGAYRRRTGLVTGYYEPILRGSRERDTTYRYPIYGRPPDLLTIDIGDLYPDLKGKRLRGRVTGNRVVPYFSRKEIDAGDVTFAGQELLWVDDAMDLFFLHIQGSGRIRMPDGSTVAVGYADQNGHPYVSIGKRLIEAGEMTPEQVTLFSIRDWLREHPSRSQDLMHSNPSYVFFVLRDDASPPGPFGAMNVPLTAGRSIAIDPTVIPLGTPLWIDTTYPDDKRTPLRRLVLAQDTGGAIRGAVRADMFWGNGTQAERLAGNMKQRGRLLVLLPKP